MITRSVALSAVVAAFSVAAAAQPAQTTDSAAKTSSCEPQPDCFVLAFPTPPPASPLGERDQGIQINGFQARSRTFDSSVLK